MEERDYRLDELVSGGDTLLHHHLADRATNAGLQSAARIVSVTSASYQVRVDDDYLLIDTSSNAVGLILPPSRNGKEYEFVLVDATNAATVTPDGTEVINGEPDMILTAQYTAIRLKAIAGGWVAI